MARVKIDKSKFDMVKILLNSKATVEEVVQYTGLGESTIFRIKSCDDFNEYRQMLAAMAVKSKKTNEAKRIQPEPEPESKQDARSNAMVSQYQINRMIELIKEQNEILKLLSNKIAFIVDELTK